MFLFFTDVFIDLDLIFRIRINFFFDLCVMLNCSSVLDLNSINWCFLFILATNLQIFILSLIPYSFLFFTLLIVFYSCYLAHIISTLESISKHGDFLRDSSFFYYFFILIDSLIKLKIFWLRISYRRFFFSRQHHLLRKVGYHLHFSKS